MWSLRLRHDNSFYLTFDSSRRRTTLFRGVWELIGPQNNSHTSLSVNANRRAGLLCCNDDEGGVRVLILEE